MKYQIQTCIMLYMKLKLFSIQTIWRNRILIILINFKMAAVFVKKLVFFWIPCIFLKNADILILIQISHSSWAKLYFDMQHFNIISKTKSFKNISFWKYVHSQNSKILNCSTICQIAYHFKGIAILRNFQIQTLCVSILVFELSTKNMFSHIKTHVIW